MSSDKPALQNTSLTGRLTHPLIWFAITLAEVANVPVADRDRDIGSDTRGGRRLHVGDAHRIALSRGVVDGRVGQPIARAQAVGVV